METMFADSLDRLLAAHCTPAVVREVERTPADGATVA